MDEAWGYRELVTGHDDMITDPQKLAQILLDLAATTSNPDELSP